MQTLYGGISCTGIGIRTTIISTDLIVLNVAPSPFYSSQEKTNLKLYIQVFCVRPHTLGRPSLRQWSHHHLFFPPASVLILRHNTWMLPCFLSKQGCDSTH